MNTCTLQLTIVLVPPSRLISNTTITSPQQIFSFQQKVGSLLYAAVISWPDIAKAANKLAELATNPSDAHIEAADRCIRYLYRMRHFTLQYSANSPGPVCQIARYAAFADLTSRRSSEGYLCLVSGAAVDWKVTKQHTITTSTTEVELLALSEAVRNLIWWNRLFSTLGFDPEHTLSILCDNQQTVDLLSRNLPQLLS